MNNKLFSVRKRVFSIKEYPFTFSNYDCIYWYIYFFTKLNDSRLGVILTYQHMNYQKIILLDPITYQISLEISHKVGFYDKFQQLPNGELITEAYMEIYDISDPSKIKKHEIIDNSKSAAYSLLLPKKELAIAYSVLQIDVHRSEYPYEYKYTLLKEKNNEVNWYLFKCW